MEYNHFQYGAILATSLKAIPHTTEKPRYFTAFGLEDLVTLEQQLSSVTGTILIAVDGFESHTENNGADALTEVAEYSFIVAQNTLSTRPDSIAQAATRSRELCKAIRNHLLQDATLSGYLQRSTQINGIGPIGDNFYGTILTFTIATPEPFTTNPDYWQ